MRALLLTSLILFSLTLFPAASAGDFCGEGPYESRPGVDVACRQGGTWNECVVWVKNVPTIGPACVGIAATEM